MPGAQVRSYIGHSVGGDWFKENVTLAIRVARAWRALNRQEKKEVKLPGRWFEVKQHRNVSPPPGARRGDTQKKEKKKRLNGKEKGKKYKNERRKKQEKRYFAMEFEAIGGVRLVTTETGLKLTRGISNTNSNMSLGSHGYMKLSRCKNLCFCRYAYWYIRT
jgi:hypothetical protein